MANSKDFILQTMKGRANTLGWGAIASYNRTKVNHLLAQQHIARFATDSFLPAIRGDILLEGEQILELTGIILSEPRLSFENASLTDSMARLHMDIVGGTVTRLDKTPGSPARVVSSFNISEQHGYRLEANIQLRKVVGLITRKSEVVLDISSATEFTSNLLEDGVSETLVGSFFKTLFASLPVELQIYSLGVLDLDEDDLLAPKDFYILTQAAPGGKDAKADTYGDGAVVLFIRTKNNFHNGVLPEDESGMPYFIPDDTASGSNDSLYSGALLLSRQAMIHWFIAPHVTTHIGRGLSFEVKDDSDQTGEYRLLAKAGSYPLPPIDIQYDHGSEHFHFIKKDITFAFTNTLSVGIRPDYRLELEWRGESTKTFHYWDDIENWWDTHKDVEVELGHAVSIIFDAALDSVSNTVNFVQSDESTFISTVNIIDGEALYQPLISKAKEELDGILKSMMDLFKSIDLPEINFFALNHLLFPENNALVLKEAFLPGDLALFGEINPALTSFSLNPLYTTIKAGDALQFEIVESRYRAKAAQVTWSVRDIDGSRSQGVITQGGQYTAPTLGLLEDKATRNVVTATYTDPQTQETRTASAMVVIVASSMAMAPSMHALDLRYDPKAVTFKVSTLTGNPVTWTPLPAGQGTLVGNGYQATYTPPGSLEGVSFLPVTVEAIDGVTQQKCSAIVLLVGAVMPLEVKPAFHPGLGPLGSVTLSNSYARSAAKSITWSVEVGDGSVDAQTGKFTAPEHITFPYSVVRCQYFDGIGTQSGYGVVHLSEIAPRAAWERVADFTIEQESGSASLFSNGLEQVMLRVSVKPLDENGNEVNLTPSERASMRLIFADNQNDLPYVGESGIPPDPAPEKQWAANKSSSGYRYYPASAPSPMATDNNSAHLYIQTRGTTPQKIAVALTRADNAEFNSTENGGSEEKDNIIVITPVVPPSYTRENYEFIGERVVGQDNDDTELNTVDYYTLRLKDGSQYIKFVSFEFEEHSSMVQWESRQYAEEMGSYTGFSFSGSKTLQFDPVFIQTIPLALRPSSTLVAGKEPAAGAMLISLHRRMDFPYNDQTYDEFTRPVHLRLIDEFGNPHRMVVQFETPTNRNKLVFDPN